RFDRRRAHVADLERPLAQRAHRASPEAPWAAPAGDGAPLAAPAAPAAGRGACAERDLKERRAATASERGSARAIICAGPMQRVPKAPITSARAGLSAALPKSSRSTGVIFRPLA